MSLPIFPLNGIGGGGRTPFGDSLETSPTKEFPRSRGRQRIEATLTEANTAGPFTPDPQMEQCYGQNKWNPNYSASIEDIDRMTTFQIDDVVLMYEKKEPFYFMDCWKILHKEPKWSDRMLELNRSSTSMKAAPIPATSTENENNPITRPEWRDSAKKRRSGGGDAASSSTAVDVLQKIHDRNGKAEAKQEEQMKVILSMKAEKLKLSEKLFYL